MVEAAPGSDTVVMRFYEGSTLHCDVRVTSAMKLRVTRNGTSVGLGTTTLTAGVWYQFNLHLKVHDTLGEVHTWVDAVADISATGLDTRNSGTAGSIDRYQIRGEFGFSMRFDDIHIWTGNDHKGLSRVTGRLPAGDGFYTDWTPSTGTDHFALVDDAAPDGDSTYVSSDTGTQRDSYEMAPLGIDPTATVHAVVAKAICRRLDIGNRILALFLRRSSTDDDGADVTPAFGYTVQAEAWETDPIAVGAWTVTNVDATEWGILDNTP
jgi:hypothetical protein